MSRDDDDAPLCQMCGERHDRVQSLKDCPARRRAVTASLAPSQVHVPRAVGEEPGVTAKAALDDADEKRLREWAGITGTLEEATPAQRAKYSDGLKLVRVEETEPHTASARGSLCLYATDDPNTFRLSPVRFDAKFEPDEEGKPARSWIQVAKVGKYAGHPQGEFAFTPKVFDEIIANFKRTQNREVPIDFEHATELPGSEGSIPQAGAPATGFCIDLRSAGKGGLFGLIEWLEPGLTYVREGRYRRFSPAVQFDATDPETGEKIGPQLTSGALTNRPFLDGMTRLAASARQTTTTRAPAHGVQTMDDKDREAEEKREAAEKPKRKMAQDGVGSAESTPKGETHIPKGALYRIASACKMDADAGEEAVMDKLKAMSAEHEEMKGRLAEMEKAHKAREAKKAKADVSKLVTLKVLQADEKIVAAALKLRVSDPETFETLYGAKLDGTDRVATEVDASSLDARLLLSEVAANHRSGPPRHTINDSNPSDDAGDSAHVRALKLMSENKTLTFNAALTRASQTMKAEAKAARAAGAR